VIPLRDENPARTAPIVTRAIIAINCAVFLYEVMLGSDLRSFMFAWGFVPERVTLALRYGEESLWAPAATVLTSMFLHGGWMHLLGNMWYLAIFGDNIEDRLGRARYVLFYLVSGSTAAAAQYFVNPASRLPTVGASGAIAAVLGAYAVSFPRARVVTLIPFFPFIQIVALPALLVLGLWFVYQFFSGALSLAWGGGGGGGIAWWAHIGGFVFGIIAVKALAPRAPSRAWVE
jgi:rhomboid family protein